MRVSFARRLVGTVVLAVAAGAGPVYSQEVRFLGTGAIPGNAVDNSGLDDLLEDGVTPNNRVGGLGSAIAHTGFATFYLATPDRGPADGTTSYTDRAYLLRIGLRPDPSSPGRYLVSPRVVTTILLATEKGRRYTGNAAAFDPTNSPASQRLDPEGIRAASCGGRFFVSDEYGPFLYEFNANGRRRRALAPPNKFLADLPSATPNDELTRNVAGRQSNRGMEGLAISPDGSKLYGIMQSALLQDGALDSANSRVGTNNRLLEVDVHTGAVREFLYTLDDRSNGVSEVLAVNDHELLVLERDGRVGVNARVKKIFKIDITDATDIRALKQLPATGVPAGVSPVGKSLFIDLLDPDFGLVGPGMPEKLEGLAFGPDLPDGRHLLFVTSDNDFVPTQPSLFFAFGIAPSALPDFEPQAIRLGPCRDKGGDEGGQ
jgi:hypothetical protein